MICANEMPSRTSSSTLWTGILVAATQGLPIHAQDADPSRRPGDWGPFKQAGAEAWRADGELAGRRMLIAMFAACGVTHGPTDWCWEVAAAEDGAWVLRATCAEQSREAAPGEVEETLWSLKEREDRLRE